MLFTSPVFLCVFLPLVLATHLVLPRVLRAPWLVIVSLFFYAWGEQQMVLFMIASVIVNWLLGLAVARAPKPAVAIAVAVNIGALVYFKYSQLLRCQHQLSARVRWATRRSRWRRVHLPIGISFFTFEAISLRRRRLPRRDRARSEPAPRRPLHARFFPHLIAGPIVRYRDIAGAAREPARVDLDRLRGAACAASSSASRRRC